MQSQRTRIIVEIALTVALSSVLSLLAVRLPINIAGGTISFAMLPIMVLALRRGPVAGVIAGALFGFVDLAVEPYIVTPVQVVLDYPLAFAAVGLTGIGAPFVRRIMHTKPLIASDVAIPFMIAGAAARLASHYVSGIVFFRQNALDLGKSPLVYSLTYNLSYLLPSAVICIVAAVIVLPVLEQAVPVVRTAPSTGGKTA